MKAILIDTVTQTVREVELPDPKKVGYGASNQAIYDLLGEGTTMMESAVYLPKNDVIFVDEEGLFNPKVGCFTFDGSHPFHGNGIICGGTAQGSSADVKISLLEVNAKVRFGILVPKDL